VAFYIIFFLLTISLKLLNLKEEGAMKKFVLFISSFSVLTVTSFCQNGLNPKIHMADSLAKNKEYQKAEQFYNEVITEEPGNNLAIYKLASLYYTEKRYDDAIKLYLRLAPNKNPRVLYNLACNYSLNNNKTEALK
jgi:tetratricopeptide (TPR) repeat protein